MTVHDQIDVIERDLLEKFNILTTIHMDPIDTMDELTNQLKQEVQNIVQALNPNYSIHDFRLVKGPTHINLIFDVLLPADDEISHQELKQKITEAIQQINSHYFCVIQIDHAFL